MLIRKGISMKRFIMVCIASITLFTGCATIQNQGKQNIDFELIKGIPVIPVKINGIVTRLAIDTGADNDEICIKKSLIDKTRIQEIEGTSQSFDVGGVKHISKLYIAKDVIIGDLKFLNVSVSEEQREIPFDGIIGNKFLEKIGTILIDYSNCKIKFLKSENINTIINEGTWNKIVYTKSNEGIILSLFYNGNTYSFVFDTGNAVFFKNDVAGIISKKLFDKITDDINASRITLKNIEIDTTKFESLSFYAVDLPEVFTADGLIGYNILVNKKIIIDYTNHILYYSK
jgi:hypothetical protein